MSCPLRIDLPGWFGYPLYPTECGPDAPFPLHPNSADLLEMGLTGALPFGTLPLPPSFRLPPVFQRPDRWRGYLMPGRTGSSPLVPPGFLMEEQPSPRFSAADLFRLHPSVLQEALETTPPSSAQGGSTSGGDRPPGISDAEPAWVGPVLHFLGRLLDSADIVLSGIPANTGADGTFRDGETGAVVMDQASEEMRCRYTEFRSNHFFPTVLREGESFQPSCTDPEYSHRPECNPGSRYVCFQPESRATVTIQVREVEGREESIVHHLAFQYARHPRVIAERVPGLRELPGIDRLPAFLLRGFYGDTPRGAQGACTSHLDETLCEGRIGPTPLGETVPSPARNYFELRYSFEDPQPAQIIPVGPSPPDPSSLPPTPPPLFVFEFSEDGMGRNPIQQIMTPIARALGEDTIEGFLEDFGLNDLEESLYRYVGVPVGGIPRSVEGFLTLIRPLFTQETNLRLSRQSLTWNPNVILDRNPLFFWALTEEVRVDALLRAGALDLAGNGTIRFQDPAQVRHSMEADRTRLEAASSGLDAEEARLLRRDLEFRRQWLLSHPTRGMANRLEVRGNESSLTARFRGAALEGLEIPLPQTSAGEPVSIRLSGLLADRVTVSTKPLHDWMSPTSIDPRPFRRIRLERPYIGSLTIHYGTIRATVRNLRAENVEYVLPSPREIRERGLNPDQIIAQGQWVVHGLEFDRLEIENPAYDLHLVVRNGRVGDLRFDPHPPQEEELPGFPFTLASAEVEGLSLHYDGLGSLTAERMGLQNLRLRQEVDRLTALLEHFQTRGSISYEDAAGETSLRLSAGTEIRNLRFQSSFPEGEPRRAEIAFDLSGDLTEGTIRTRSIREVRLRGGRIEGGHFRGEAVLPREEGADWTYSAELQGNVSLNIERIDRFESEFNLPGFAMEGNFRNVHLTGDTRILIAHDRWALERREGSEIPLAFGAEIVETRVRHDPSASDRRLRRVAHHEAARTDSTIHHATLAIDDLVRLASLPPPPPTGEGVRSSRPMEIHFRGLRITDIENSGEIWAPLPPWRYLRAILPIRRPIPMPQRGRLFRALPEEGDCSRLPGGVPDGIATPENFVFLGEWQSRPDAGGRRETHLSDLRTCLHTEVIDEAGNRSFMVLGIPTLNIHPGGRPLVSTEDTPIHLDTCMIDLTRGGWICMTPAPRR
jgi:hypothetical protein